MSDTLDLFATPKQFEHLSLPDADVSLMRTFYTPSLSRRYLDILLAETPWRHEKISICGQEHWQPRLTAWYGDPGARYSYSGITLAPNPWTDTLAQIKNDMEHAIGRRFNSVLLNLYRDERDSMGWHSDNEAELGAAPVIASLSLGETRVFKFKHRTRRDLKPLAIELRDGDLLIMAGATQKFWLHGIDKERTPKGPRINLTFRSVFNKFGMNE